MYKASQTESILLKIIHLLSIAFSQPEQNLRVSLHPLPQVTISLAALSSGAEKLVLPDVL